MATASTKVLLIVGVVIALIGWACALGGTAKFTDMCNDYNTSTACANQLQYPWWGIWFNFFLALAVLLVALQGNAGWNTTLQALLAACLSVTMLDSRDGINMSSGSTGVSALDSAADAAAAGFIIMSLADVLLIIFLGITGGGISVDFKVVAARVTPVSHGGATKVAPKEDAKARVESA